MSVNIYDSNTGQLQKIAGLLENENIGVPKAGTYTSDNSSNADNIKALDTALVNINQTVSNVADNIADDNDEYNSNHNYVVGEYCISPDDGSLQKCVVATSGGSWATVKDTCFTKDSLTNVVKTLNNDLNSNLPITTRSDVVTFIGGVVNAAATSTEISGGFDFDITDYDAYYMVVYIASSEAGNCQLFRRAELETLSAFATGNRPLVSIKTSDKSYGTIRCERKQGNIVTMKYFYKNTSTSTVALYGINR